MIRYDLAEEPPLPVLIAQVAAEHPDRPYLDVVGGDQLTYGEVDVLARRWAAAFASHGVGPGDRVLSMLDPSSTALCAWLGAAWLRAIEVGVNTQYHGAMLEYLLADSGARLIVIEAAYLDRLAGIDLAKTAVELVVVTSHGSAADPADGPRRVTVDELLEGHAPAQGLAEPQRHDISCLMYTSGTTGPSKGVRVPWAQLFATLPAEWETGAGPDEAYYAPFPVYHIAGKAPPCLMARLGGRVVYRSRFSVEAFWGDIRRHGCTFALLAGAVPAMLMSRPESPDDADNPLRVVLMAPIIAEHDKFARRFGVRLVTGYNMTETSTPIYKPDGITDHHSCGRLRTGYPGYEVRIVDDHDNELPDGHVGQLIVRTAVPWTLNDGYHGRTDATAAAWRNGWFHTGDAFRRDDDGNYYFVDRRADVIRRRGENISSFELESLVNSHPAVAESAAVAVGSELGEDDVMIYVRLAADADIDHAGLHRDLAAMMPRFMLPRYIEFVDDLPKTEATLRIQKALLRASGPSQTVWDADRRP